MVGSSNHKTFILNRGIVTDIMAATPAFWLRGWGVVDILSVTMARLGIKDLVVATFHQSGGDTLLQK